MLLCEPPQPEYPIEYLLSRLMGRKAAASSELAACLAGSLPLPWATASEIGKNEQAERLWLYRQLPARLRRDLAPVFIFHELPLLINLLRMRRAGASPFGPALPPGSLLCPEAEKTLNQAETADELAGKITALLAARLAPGFGELAGLYPARGLAAFEQSLYRLFFTLAGVGAKNAAVRLFFRELVDLRNLLALAKAHYWREEMAFIPGGLFAANWEKALAEPGRAEKILAVFGWPDGLPKEIATLSALEDFLLRRIGRTLRRRAAGEAPADRLIDYLWFKDILAKNQGLLYYRRLTGDDIKLAKVIQ